MTSEDTRGAALAALGWDASFGAALRAIVREHDGRDLVPARVVAEHRTGHVVHDGEQERGAPLRGTFRHDAGEDPLRLPAVGDWVALDEAGAIRALVPRRGALVRRAAGGATVAQVAAANVDVALLVAALPDGVNPRRLERLAATAWEGGAIPVVVLTKRDLCDAAALAAARALAAGAAPGCDVLAVSATSGDGVPSLAARLAPGRTAVLLGVSGAGKSTLLNHLLGADRLRTAAVRETDGKGRHTTTHRELVRLAGGALLVDTPGIRELALWGTGEGLDAAFDDVARLAGACRFADCAHEREPGCAVRLALEAGSLEAERLESWRALQRELAWLARRQDQRALHEERARNRVIHRAARLHIRRKYE